jgi:superfamily I DNA/RNA helicase
MSNLEETCMNYFNEERRLMHVAITRGRENVFLSYLRWYETKTCWFEAKRSYFLDKLVQNAKRSTSPVSKIERTANKFRGPGGGGF